MPTCGIWARRLAPSIALLALAVAGAALVRAQRAETNPLSRVKRLTCVFRPYVSAAWDASGVPQFNTIEAEVRFDFDPVDIDQGSAQLISTLGRRSVTAHLARSNLSFVEMNSTGLVIVTTVFSTRLPSGKFPAVYAHHQYIPLDMPGYISEPIVSEHYGVCEARE